MVKERVCRPACLRRPRPFTAAGSQNVHCSRRINFSATPHSSEMFLAGFLTPLLVGLAALGVAAQAPPNMAEKSGELENRQACQPVDVCGMSSSARKEAREPADNVGLGAYCCGPNELCWREFGWDGYGPPYCKLMGTKKVSPKLLEPPFLPACLHGQQVKG